MLGTDVLIFSNGNTWMRVSEDWARWRTIRDAYGIDSHRSDFTVDVVEIESVEFLIEIGNIIRSRDKVF